MVVLSYSNEIAQLTRGIDRGVRVGARARACRLFARAQFCNFLARPKPVTLSQSMKYMKMLVPRECATTFEATNDRG